MSKAKKCSAKAWCSAMTEFALAYNGYGRALFVSKTINRKTHKMGKGAAYRYGRKMNDVVWLNYCPWCGEPTSYSDVESA